MRKTENKLQVVHKAANKKLPRGLTRNIGNDTFLSAMAKQKAPTQPMFKRVFIEPDEKENAIITATMDKHGLRNAVDVLRMALRRLAEHEGLQLKAS